MKFIPDLTSFVRFIPSFWRSHPLFRLAVAPAMLVGLILIMGWLLSWLLPDQRQMWSVSNVDWSVLVGLAFLLTLALVGWLLSLALPNSTAIKRMRRDAPGLIGAALVLLSVYVAYASFRNQMQQMAYATLNEEGSGLFNLEMSHPEVRCLYSNYGYEHPEVCLENVVSDSVQWSFGLFYVEEAWFILERAQEDRAIWGSNFAASIESWAEDVSRDPTGLFSYYLVSTEDSMDQANARMVEAGVRVDDLCAHYRTVWSALVRHSAQPQWVSGAALECGLRTPALLRLIQ